MVWCPFLLCVGCAGDIGGNMEKHIIFETDASKELRSAQQMPTIEVEVVMKVIKLDVNKTDFIIGEVVPTKRIRELKVKAEVQATTWVNAQVQT
jgi:hypothetical protein